MGDILKHPLDLHSNNLPTPSTSLIGRAQERQAICDLLASPEVRLLTLTGVGGIGKTRLALAVAGDLEQTFTHGVHFVSFVTLREADQVVPAIAQALGLREESGRAFAEQLETFLHKKRLLLVLDNFEQLTAAAPQLIKLLAACPQIKILVTSRAVLHVTGEHIFQVPPLVLPDLKCPLDLKTLAGNEAVMLFVQRARQIRSSFQLTDEHASVIAQICVRLEGIPLALELAAARSRLLSPKSLLSRLEQRLQILTSTQQDLPLRQQALRFTIKWSYDLLSEDEQRLFRRLSVFVGGCTLEAIEAVYTILGENPEPVLDGATSLLDKSLILQHDENNGEPRLLMLETLREFGLECLEATGELQECQCAHAKYYCLLVQQAVPSAKRLIYYSPLVKLIKQDYANIRTALSVLLMRNEIVPALQVVNAMGGFWFVSEMFNEGCQLLEPVISASYTDQTDAVLSLRVHALFYIGYLAFWQRDVANAKTWLEDCLELAQKLEDKRAWALALRILGMIESWYPGGDNKRCKALYEKSLSISYGIDGIEGIAEVLGAQGTQEFFCGHYVAALKLFQKSLEIDRSLGYSWGIGINLLYLGWSFYLQGNVAEAHHQIEESLAFFRKMGNPPYTDDALVVLGLVLLSKGDEMGAQQSLEEALALGHRLGKTEYLLKAFYGLGCLALQRGNVEQAYTFYENGIKVIKELQL